VLAAIFIPIERDDQRSPLHILEHALSPWVAFMIVPLFGFANAGVSLLGMSISVLIEPVVIAVAAGLFLGKQVGILGGIALAEKLGFARRPGRASWAQIYGVALLAGIGFTMSLFIGGLAFPGNAPLMDEVKIGVLGGSILSALAGFCVLRFAKPVPEAT
jgi:NhaA family Na+:H+ antiporter